MTEAGQTMLLLIPEAEARDFRLPNRVMSGTV
jgi:hypothetical protein